MNAAVDLLAELGGTKQTVAVLGDMLELGPQSSAFHQDVGKHVASASHHFVGELRQA